MERKSSARFVDRPIAAIGEWRSARTATRLLVLDCIAFLLGAVGLISYGNCVAALPAAH